MTNYSKTFTLQAGEGTPRRNMPPGLLFARCIEAATDHAVLLGIGFDRLIESNQSWVLSRMSVEVTRMPQVDESFTINTWVNSVNRSMSERFFEITGADGRPCAYARSTWVALNIATRSLGDLSGFLTDPAAITSDRPIPMAAARRLKPLPADAPELLAHTFKYCDLDSNLHVNTVRYIEMLLNGFSPEFHALHHLKRLDVAFLRECTYGEHGSLAAIETEANCFEAEIRVDGEPRVRFNMMLNN